MTIDEMRRRLAPMNLAEVARQVGIHQNVLYRIANGTTDPRVSTFERIRMWLERNA